MDNFVDDFPFSNFTNNLAICFAVNTVFLVFQPFYSLSTSVKLYLMSDHYAGLWIFHYLCVSIKSVYVQEYKCCTSFFLNGLGHGLFCSVLVFCFLSIISRGVLLVCIPRFVLVFFPLAFVLFVIYIFFYILLFSVTDSIPNSFVMSSFLKSCLVHLSTDLRKHISASSNLLISWNCPRLTAIQSDTECHNGIKSYLWMSHFSF